MNEFVYPALFTPNEDGSFTITFPDLEGCISEGKTLGNAIIMAQSALSNWIEYLVSKHLPIPTPSALASIATEGKQLVNLICVCVRDDKAVKRTVSIPKWMDDKVSQQGISLSKVLQDALYQRLS